MRRFGRRESEVTTFTQWSAMQKTREPLTVSGIMRQRMGLMFWSTSIYWQREAIFRIFRPFFLPDQRPVTYCWCKWSAGECGEQDAVVQIPLILWIFVISGLALQAGWTRSSFWGWRIRRRRRWKESVIFMIWYQWTQFAILYGESATKENLPKFVRGHCRWDGMMSLMNMEMMPGY